MRNLFYYIFFRRSYRAKRSANIALDLFATATKRLTDSSTLANDTVKKNKIKAKKIADENERMLKLAERNEIAIKNINQLIGIETDEKDSALDLSKDAE